MKPAGSAKDPLWYKDAIIYELHVRAFHDSNGDGIGDFPGLIQKLDYLQELGVTCLWLLPFFPSPLRDDGYDIGDYMGVHPDYGTLEDVKQFIREAHRRNIQVMFELVINHTSDQHPWFQRARLAPAGSLERDFYVWSDNDKKYPDVRIIFTDTEKSNWTWDPEANAYYWHRFFSHQPDLNYDNPTVFQEVVRVMQYWLDFGIDGLRLDAIPYLVERDGTNCENLPETHVVIRNLRRELDDRFANRVILAEANQWPTDVRPYFGDGDECHMAFHFPLMPRIFMALRLEDRHPITEIMAQTPEIPESCQWGLFLRNHDELTLEMVSDEERDYMYVAYSADPRMRVNVGIRRRLFPLMENNRRRVELLNSLLFSFPGTPVLYYGDEIGMGDNIYLGDRNGVRTPMQWSADRNAGFSRATPAKLYSPVIMDPVYGYEAINVEAQQSDPSSFLYWMRNMIGLRKLYHVFGRGSMHFLFPSNRKVLAYIRRDDHHKILCVANLSRFAQPVELDLAEFDGMVPVEMIGCTEFPAVDKRPYRLTLQPYGFFWFELQDVARQVAPTALEVLVVGSGARWTSILERPLREIMETRVLPRFLRAQRWYGAKARKIQSTRIRDWLYMPGESEAALLILEVDYGGDRAAVYFIPISTSAESEAARIQEQYPGALMCRVSVAGRVLLVHDATVDPAFGTRLLDAIGRGQSLSGSVGALVSLPSTRFAEVRGEEADLPVMRGSAEQSNTSIRFGSRLILKLFRRLEAGINPDYEISRFLNEQTTFDRIPPLAGGLEYRPHGRISPTTVGMLQGLVENQGDGWEWTLDSLSRYYELCATLDHGPNGPDEDVASIQLYIDSVTLLGMRTAEMHLALASGTSAAFAPEPLDRGALTRLAAHLEQHASRVFDSLRDSLSTMPEEIVDKAAMLVNQRLALLDRFAHLDGLDTPKGCIRVHGDYHLGQVLRARNDWVILDFEGEPARPLAERRKKEPPLKDVAGMLRSFSYAAQSGLMAHITRHPDPSGRLHAWARYWEDQACRAFLNAYKEHTAGAEFLPSTPEAFDRLLQIYVLDKALYEVHYELNNRPAWLPIPLAGILALLHKE